MEMEINRGVRRVIEEFGGRVVIWLENFRRKRLANGFHILNFSQFLITLNYRDFRKKKKKSPLT